MALARPCPALRQCTTIHNQLLCSSVSHKKLQHIASERDEDKRANFIACISQYAPHELGFIDEVSKDEWSIGRRYGPELGDGHVGTRLTISLKDVWVLDIISRVGNRLNGNSSRRNRNGGNQGSMLVWRSRSPSIHILITTKNVDYFPANGKVESRSGS